MSKYWKLPPPPGKWRSKDFCQSFGNYTKEPVTIYVHEESLELMPGEEIEICWYHHASYWKLGSKQGNGVEHE